MNNKITENKDSPPQPAQEIKKPKRYKRSIDRTGAKRQADHLAGLGASNGRRIPFDFNGDYIAMMEELKAAGYGKNYSDVVRQALSDAHSKVKKK